MPDGARDSATIARHYDAMASQYDRAMRVFERAFVGDGREWVCSQARGDVLEIAVGTGRNLPYYAADVRLVGIDISPGMLEYARERERETDYDVDLQVGDAQALDFAEQSFDTVVSTLTMCTIPDYQRAISEAARVLRPGGRFLLLEHVGNSRRVVRFVQRVLYPIAMRCCCDHLLREPAAMMAAAGLYIEQLERSKLGIIERLVVRKAA